MNWLIILSGVLAACTAAVHIFAGGRDVARPLLASDLGETLKLTLYACWHLVSVALVLSSLALLADGIGAIGPSKPMVGFICVSWLLFGMVFVFVTLGIAKPRGLFRFPQWVLLLPVGVFGLWGIA